MEIFDVVPDAAAYGGAAVADLPSGKRCFIRGAVPGDRLRVEIVSEKRSFAVGKIIEILSPSAERIVPECPHAGECMGCAYAQMNYDAEIGWKQKQLERFLVHSGLVSGLEEPVRAPERLFWRNKIQLTCEKKDGKFTAGYLGEDNKTILPVSECLLAQKEISEKMRSLLKDEKFISSLPEGRTKLTFRCTKHDGVICPEAGEGGKYLKDMIPGFGDFLVGKRGFFQINNAAASALLRYVSFLMKKISPAVFQELYCGCGVFSAAAASCGIRRIFGVELDRTAIECAKRNLAERGFPRCRFLAGDAFRCMGELPPADENTLLLVDPPRTGLEKSAAETLAASRAKYLICVSCGPDTLARDLNIFVSRNWKVRSAKLFDLFPSTAHFETVVLLEREVQAR